MTEAESKAIIGPHPFNLAMRRIFPVVILAALLALSCAFGSDGLAFSLLLVLALAIATPMCFGFFLGTLCHIPSYEYLLAELKADSMPPGYALGPQDGDGYLLIDTERDMIAFGKSKRKVTELRRVELNSNQNKNFIEFVFNSGDNPVVKCQIFSQDKAKTEFVKINNILGFSMD